MLEILSALAGPAQMCHPGTVQHMDAIVATSPSPATASLCLTDHCKLPDLAGGAHNLQTSSVAQGFHEAQLTNFMSMHADGNVQPEVSGA